MSDVVVIGGGLAGWRAAEAAVEVGASVTLVANGAGNSPHIHALNCPVRADDSVERMFADTMASGHGTNDARLVRVLCEGAARLKEEFAFDRDVRGEYVAIQPLGSSVPRCVSIGHAIGAVALRRIRERLRGHVRVVDGRVVELRRGEGGCRREGAPETVAGRLAPQETPARGAPETLAGCIAPQERNVSGAPRPAREDRVNYEVVVVGSEARHALSARAVVIATGGWCGRYDFSTNPPYLRGDGIALAQGLGAATVDMDVVQYEPTVRVEGARRGVPVITTLLYRGATLRNARGEEFIRDARVNKDVLAQAIAHEQGQAKGVVYDLTGVDEADLVACKMDPHERRILVAPAPHTSLGGVKIDERCRVLDTQGRPIAGLYATGEVTGGLHGRNRLGGNAGTEVLVFGWIAGREAAEHARAERV